VAAARDQVRDTRRSVRGELGSVHVSVLAKKLLSMDYCDGEAGNLFWKLYVVSLLIVVMPGIFRLSYVLLGKGKRTDAATL